ncbi:MAG: Smr/MutS family protein [Anaerolineales bacterium]|nr:Smr/MutS family protein [Anaerolineales bacterium]
MDPKTLSTLEYPKVLARLAERCAFSGSEILARALHPTTDLETARRWQVETTEARRLLETRPNTTIGGAHDIRQQAEATQRGVVLPIPEILDVKNTLIAARELARLFERTQEHFPNLTEIASRLPQPPGLIDAITKVISERGDIHDHASPRLSNVRRDLRVVHDRLLSRMQRMLNDPDVSPYLQDNLITTRDGRYVIPLRADFKGKVKSIVHDQSSSGATLFVEPLGVVELNNEYRQLQLDERDEEHRILAELCGKIADHAEELIWMVETVADLDLAFAKAKYAEDLAATEPRLHSFPVLGTVAPRKGEPPRAEHPAPTNGHPGSIIRLEGSRHPLLNPDTVVPIDLVLDSSTYALIITGPNTGGKTISLKTTGLLALMAQSGLHLPTDPGSEITVFENIFADIGDEQSIEQSLSTFSGHITNIIRILEEADPQSLVLFDELGSGTDPQEGAALASSILTHLLDRRITTFVATHYPELKTYAHNRSGVVNASVEFDVETLRPTYRLIIGLPGVSNALTIAQRLGLPEKIVAVAREGLPQQELQAADLLAEIHQQRDLLRKTRLDADRARNDVTRLREDLLKRLEKLEDERREVLEKARRQAAARLEEVEEEVRELRRQLARARQPLEVVEEIAEKVEVLEDIVAAPTEREFPVAPSTPTEQVRRPLRLGDKVRLRSLGALGVLTTLGEDEAEVQIGMMRVRTRLTELVRGGDSESTEVEKPTSRRKKKLLETVPEAAPVHHPAVPGIELDLRGQRVEEALEKLTDYLDRGYLAQVPFVRVIHGKGTGRLRDAVREALRQNAKISHFETGLDGEGGDGVTVVKFVE